jgi:hypothetical protein
MRKLIALFALLGVLMLAGSATAVSTARVPAFPVLPGDWSHAEINMTIGGVQHTVVLDRGQIQKLSGRVLRLREKSNVVTIPVSAASKVVIDGAPARLRWLNPTMKAETMRIDGGPAVRIDAKTS